MNGTYWNQWSHLEIMSMHGVELDDCHDGHHYDREDVEPEEESCCSGCMDCLGFSWRDFM